MNQKEGKISLSSTLALVGSGVGLGLGLAGLGALWLQRTDMLVRGRAANVDKQLDAIRERQQANDAQLAADLTLFRQVLQAYQPTPEPGYFGSSSPPFPPAPAFPPSMLATVTPAAEAAYESINRNRNPDVALPNLTDLFDEPLADFTGSFDEPLAESESVTAPATAMSVVDFINQARGLPNALPEVKGTDLAEELNRLTASTSDELRHLFGSDE